ncbi:uncharacterized protein ACA1_391070 [Acanthamoeba castellanii str. Neff]|uniref:Arf-GAP domain-containing protein n=1 Tax=Acanthamoeba castellanii (strain ATCC 30010 / Neff) TaxID=1257118 RepID=L8GP48_ACACF|nr:uncharacterized protein ACA1_391070 [Acanthamoeba castellanii str. Neff]ELR14750.1 hypothetical protein ACA1_391070 [Acanthamoeba castellanii str. Neff]
MADSGWNSSRMSCPSGSNGAAKLKRLLTLPGNRRCADCGAPDPQWASLTFGSIFCIRCSGVHRSLGTTVSRVRSLELDRWTPAQVKSLKTRGNDLVNGILENDVPSHVHKPTPRSSFEELTAWIQAKYVEQRFRPTPKTAAEWARFEAEDARLLCDSAIGHSPWPARRDARPEAAHTAQPHQVLR